MQVPDDLARTLAVVVDAGSLDAASRHLHLTQSAVSQRIAALERAVGQVLLVRSRPVRATPAGSAVIRYARQLEHLHDDLASALGADAEHTPRVRLAVNADSLSTWLLAPLARVCERHGIAVALHREDEARTADLLVDGSVLAAITTRGAAVPGCTVTPLGTMSYRAAASRTYADRWLPHGPTAASLARAPVVDFDGDDNLQSRWLSEHAPGATPPRHQVPSSTEFREAIHLGMGWGMLFAADVHGSDLVDLGGPTLDVPLFWQQWRLSSTALTHVAEAVIAAARGALGDAQEQVS
ncbi:LysR family transcriptional regulator ArgP [Demequina activiva]|uniref:Transcriptional regulator ArgP n=1 Tax=Demequina activiva TaxID=1582364 RepID=A0A919Q5S5_9MICO|nr:LysR family transcriptional regulator ArgP [Demequina activiva]GIG54783.1 transcriptional regulator ArgP [Demequina activiva]